ncbi:interleukin-20 receptor subunit alpha-like isoform X2 [Eleginops maclovinus]|uniref:interleukin-20 receptor subunit alpha-like isoform X2 n=1 Tax=Eleginops maclovinus TaxID=56733 RepID=UPI00308006AC
MMNCLPLVLYLVSLLDSVISTLPAPCNLSMESVNLCHVLSWVPGPGTPQRTQYKIIKRVGKKQTKNTQYSNTTSIKLKLHKFKEYELTVQASYNQTLSEESKPYIFNPITQTKIGPPIFSLLGCGNCLKINISLTIPDKIHKIYNPTFKVSWWKPGEEARWTIATPSKNYTLTNLQNGTEYCVKVLTEINVNSNTEPSTVKCIFTSIVEPSKDPVILGTVAALLIVAVIVLMTSMFGLYYTGFICRPNATLPKPLIALSHGYILTLDRIIPDNISISERRKKPRKHNSAMTLQPATRGADSSEEDEDEEGNMYLDGGAELSSGESSCKNSVDASGNSKVSASGRSGTLMGKMHVLHTVMEIEAPHGGLDGDEPKAEGSEISFISDGPIAGEVEEEQVCEVSGNINLFSVTLAALAAWEEHDTRDSLTDLLKRSDLVPLLHTHTHTESDDQTAVALLLPTEEDMTESTCADTFSGCVNNCDDEMQHEETTEEEDDEEEDEFSAYMKH